MLPEFRDVRERHDSNRSKACFRPRRRASRTSFVADSVAELQLIPTWTRTQTSQPPFHPLSNQFEYKTASVLSLDVA